MKKEEDIQELNFIKWGKCAVKGLFNKLKLPRGRFFDEYQIFTDILL